jgi:hypothetical protein
MKGFIKLYRSEQAINLQHNMCANHLLYVIALRASRSGNPVLGLKPGDAMLGDYNNYGMSRQQYRTALKNLESWGYIKLNLTNKGAIASICNSAVYDINSDEPNHQLTIKQPSTNHQVTIKQPSANHQLTTNKNNKNINNDKNEIIKESKKGDLSFSFKKIDNPELIKLEEYELKAATIVSDYFLNLNFLYEDFTIFKARTIQRAEIDENDVPMKNLNKAFLTYIHTMNINNIQQVQILIKSIMHVPNIYRYGHIIDAATQQIRISTQNKYKRFYLENIKQ